MLKCPSSEFLRQREVGNFTKLELCNASGAGTGGAPSGEAAGAGTRLWVNSGCGMWDGTSAEFILAAQGIISED
jgi:hypothetical protein